MSKPEDPHPAPDKAPNLIEWLGFSISPDFSRARFLGGTFGVILCLLFFLCVVAVFTIVISSIVTAFDPASSGPNLGAGALIAAILAAPFVIWRTHIAQRTVDLQHQGQITDRISKAVEQLGAEKTIKRQLRNRKGTLLFENDDAGKLDYKKPILEEVTLPNLEVRIGGLYALERIAQDSMTFDKGRDHISIMEILCVYIRENAKASEASDSPPDLTTENLQTWARALQPPRTDIQTALEVIGRRSPAQIALERAPPAHGTKVYRLDLRNSTLQRAELWARAFDHALFTDTRLAGADLWGGADEGGIPHRGADAGGKPQRGADAGGNPQVGADGGGRPQRGQSEVGRFYRCHGPDAR